MAQNEESVKAGRISWPRARLCSASSDAVLTFAEVERRHILETLERLGGSRKETARALGIGQNTLWRKLKQYGAAAR